MIDYRSNRLKRIKIQSFLTCFLALSTLAAAGTATFAWFSTNKRATAKYMNIVATDSAIVQTANYYRIKEVNGNTYKFSTDRKNVYDLLPYERELGNGAYQILIEVKFKKTEVPFTVNAFTAKDVLGGKNSWENIDWSVSPFPLSSIIQFTYFGTNADTSAREYISVTKNNTTDTGFITMNGDAPSFKGNLKLGEEANGQNPIYIMLDYNEKAITSIYSYNIGNPKFDGDYSANNSSSSGGVRFKSDFSIAIYPKN